MSPIKLFSLVAIIAAVSLVTSRPVFAFSYTFTNNGADIVTHAGGYDGTGGIVNVTIGIDPDSEAGGSSNTALMTQSVLNVINTWNNLVPTTNNLATDPNMMFSQVDFESVLLHEVGHSLGLGHNNMGAQTGVAAGERDYASASAGVDGMFSFGAGADGVIGSRDDLRGDDVNLNYFRAEGGANDNDPFSLAATIDSTTYSRDLTDLPGADTYAGIASRQNGALFGLATTEAVMNQGSFNNEVQRTLGHDDVAGILYANSGIDSIAGTADDYTLNITFAGLTTAADIVIDFDNGTGFADSTSSGASFIAGSGFQDVSFTTNRIRFNDGFDWFYNQTSNATAVPEPSSFAAIGLICFVLSRRRRIGNKRRPCRSPLCDS